MKKKVKKVESVKKVKFPAEDFEASGTDFVEEVPVVKELGIGLLTDDFGRGDLNLMRDKLNEVINKLNVS